jgi:ribosomal-protein-alanine N-acetyltransferase
MQILETERLKLIPFTLELKKLALHDRERIADELGIHLSNDWPAADYLEALPIFIRRGEEDPFGAIWDGIIVHKADRLAIGGMGFHSGPDDTDAVEIGYDIVPAYRNCGYATEMAQRLIAWAFTQPRIIVVKAGCFSHNIGSVRVLEKVGMHCISRNDNALYWEIKRF